MVLAAAGWGLGGCGSAALQTAAPPKDISPAATTVIFDCSGKAHVRPMALTLYCADAGQFLTGVTWSDWGTATAHGVGTLVVNTCTPDCAAGNSTRERAVLQARGLSLSGTDASYSSLTVAASHARTSRTYTYSSYSLTINGPVPR